LIPEWIDEQGEERLVRRDREVKALDAVAASASSSLNLHELLHLTLQKMIEVSDSGAGLVVLFDENTQTTKLIGVPEALCVGLKTVSVGMAAEDDETSRRILASQHWADVLAGQLEQSGFVHTVSVPITANDKVHGVYALGSKEQLAVRSTDIFVSMARQVGLAVENANVHAALQEEKERLERLYRISKTLSTSLQTKTVARLILREALQATGVNRGSFWLLQGDEVTCLSEVKPHSKYASLLGLRRPLGAARVMEQLAEAKAPLIINNTQELIPRGLTSAEAIESYDVHSFLAVPMTYRDQVKGFLFLDEAGHQRTFTEADAQFLSLLADQASLAIHNAQLFDQIVQEKRLMENVLSSFADGVCVTDLNCRILNFSPGAEQLTGWQASEVDSKTCETVLDMRDEGGMSLCRKGDCLVGQATDSQRTLTLPKFRRHLIRHRSGDAIPTFVTIVPWLNQEGTLQGKVIALWDARGEERISQLKDEFLSMIWHELRTPISNISIATQLLRREGTNISADTIAEVVDIVETQSQRLNHLASQVIDAAKLSVGELPVRLRPTAVFPLLYRVVALARPRARDTRLTIKPPTDTDDSLWIIADEDHLLPVLNNLVDNALKYADSGKEVILSFMADPESDMVDIQVRDFGPGISARHLERIFDKFYRVNGTDGRKVYGTGLGLYLSRQLVEAQGGTLTAESQVGKGSVFHLCLPRSHVPGEDEQ